MKKKKEGRRIFIIAACAVIVIAVACICFRLYAEDFFHTVMTDSDGSATTSEETLTTEPAQEESAAESELTESELTESELVENETSKINGEAVTGTSEEATGETGGEGEAETTSEATGDASGEEGDETKEEEQTLDLSSVTAVLYHEGGGYISDFISGISYSSVLNWLSLHREDDYYLGTPYPSEADGTLIGGSSGSTDRRNPNGDCETSYGNDDYEGEAMLNCTGFVWHVFYKASGMTAEEAFDTIPCWGGVGAKDWISYLRSSGLEYKTYYGSADSLETLVAAMIADGYMEPGDIIWTWGEGTVLASDGLPSKSSDPHVGIYTGTYFGGDADEWWHSLGYSTATDTFYGENLYCSITPMAPCVAMTVIKLGNS